MSALAKLRSLFARRPAGAPGAPSSAEDGSALALARQVLGDGFTSVIDVGARAAGMEKSWWRLEGLAGYFGFEPDPAECARLNAARSSAQARETYFPTALGETRGEGVLHVTLNPACSSLYQPDEAVIARYPDLAVARETGRLKVAMVSLNEWWQENGRPDVCFVKVDTQGSELDILRGGVDVLKGCVGCEVEVEFSPIYKQQPLFHEVDAFMRAQGFVLWRLYGLCHYTEGPGGEWTRSESVSYGGQNRTFQAGSGRLFWANAVYFRDREDAIYQENRGKLLVLLALLEGCGDHDGVAALRRKLVAERMIPAPAGEPGRH